VLSDASVRLNEGEGEVDPEAVAELEKKVNKRYAEFVEPRRHV
jgi:hypothetical protein